MSARFTLDVPSFQKLLAAAWVLQRQRDQKLSHAGVRAVEVERRIQNPDVALQGPSANLLCQKDAGEVGKKPVLSEVAAPYPTAPVCTLAEKPELATAAVLASGPKCLPTPVEVPTARLGDTRLQNQAPVRIRRPLTMISTAARRRKKDGVTITLRLVIPQRSLRVLKASVAPISLLLIIAGFLLSLPFGQKPAQASPRVETQSRQGGLRDSLESNKISYTDPAKADPADGGVEAGVPMEPSHLRITDPATASVVHDLSSYEIQNLQRQAEYGDQFAALALGMAYETGHYVHRSCTKAAEWIAFAATSGNAAAQYNLALRYFHGDGLPQDSKQGKKWLRIAAVRGYQRAALAAELR